MQDCGQTDGKLRLSGEGVRRGPKHGQGFESLLAGCLHFFRVRLGGGLPQAGGDVEQRLFDNGELKVPGYGATVQLQTFRVNAPDTIHIRKILEFALK